MLDQPDHDDVTDSTPNPVRGSYPPQLDQRQVQHGDYYHAATSMSQGQQQPPRPTSHPRSTENQIAAMAEMIDPDDPMLDADPFGLSASMHYPTAYSFEQAPRRSVP